MKGFCPIIIKTDPVSRCFNKQRGELIILITARPFQIVQKTRQIMFFLVAIHIYNLDCTATCIFDQFHKEVNLKDYDLWLYYPIENQLVVCWIN
jgi:hypothetical protein